MRRRRRDRAVLETIADANAEDCHGLAVSATPHDDCGGFRPNRQLSAGEDVDAGSDSQCWIRKRQTGAAWCELRAHPTTVKVGHRARRRIECGAIQAERQPDIGGDVLPGDNVDERPDVRAERVGAGSAFEPASARFDADPPRELPVGRTRNRRAGTERRDRSPGKDAEFCTAFGPGSSRRILRTRRR